LILITTSSVSIFLDSGIGRKSNNAYKGAEKVQRYLNRAQSKASHVTQRSTADHFGQLDSKPHSCARALFWSQKSKNRHRFTCQPVRLCRDKVRAGMAGANYHQWISIPTSNILQPSNECKIHSEGTHHGSQSQRLYRGLITS
jgi:hypothetical protein